LGPKMEVMSKFPKCKKLMLSVGIGVYRTGESKATKFPSSHHGAVTTIGWRRPVTSTKQGGADDASSLSAAVAAAEAKGCLADR
jgi:hypothetical protein